jgi:hypothetical protein
MISAQTQQKILDLCAVGNSQRRIERILGVSRATIAAILRRGRVAESEDMDTAPGTSGSDSESPTMRNLKKIAGCNWCDGPGRDLRCTCVECLARAAILAKLPRRLDRSDDAKWLDFQVDNLPPRVVREE